MGDKFKPDFQFLDDIEDDGADGIIIQNGVQSIVNVRFDQVRIRVTRARTAGVNSTPRAVQKSAGLMIDEPMGWRLGEK
jgi:hypothetical protein